MMEQRSKARAIAIHPATSFPVATASEEDADEQPSRPTFLEFCWPALFGFLLAIIAEHLRLKVTHEWGEVGDRLVFPWVNLAARPELGMSDPRRFQRWRFKCSSR